LPDLAVEIGALDAERRRSLGHAPSVLIEHGGDVLALEALARVAQLVEPRRP
jgi:hypothetical protein